jgi:hypothetical protein
MANFPHCMIRCATVAMISIRNNDCQYQTILIDMKWTAHQMLSIDVIK